MVLQFKNFFLCTIFHRILKLSKATHKAYPQQHSAIPTPHITIQLYVNWLTVTQREFILSIILKSNIPVTKALINWTPRTIWLSLVLCNEKHLNCYSREFPHKKAKREKRSECFFPLQIHYFEFNTIHFKLNPNENFSDFMQKKSVLCICGIKTHDGYLRCFQWSLIGRKISRQSIWF